MNNSEAKRACAAVRMVVSISQKVGYNPGPAWDAVLTKAVTFDSLAPSGVRTIIEFLRDGLERPVPRCRPRLVWDNPRGHLE